MLCTVYCSGALVRRRASVGVDFCAPGHRATPRRAAGGPWLLRWRRRPAAAAGRRPAVGWAVGRASYGVIYTTTTSRATETHATSRWCGREPSPRVLRHVLRHVLRGRAKRRSNLRGAGAGCRVWLTTGVESGRARAARERACAAGGSHHAALSVHALPPRPSVFARQGLVLEMYRAPIGHRARHRGGSMSPCIGPRDADRPMPTRPTARGRPASRVALAPTARQTTARRVVVASRRSRQACSTSSRSQERRCSRCGCFPLLGRGRVRGLVRRDAAQHRLAQLALAPVGDASPSPILPPPPPPSPLAPLGGAAAATRRRKSGLTRQEYGSTWSVRSKL